MVVSKTARELVDNLIFFNRTEVSKSTDDIGEKGIVEFKLPEDLIWNWGIVYHETGSVDDSDGYHTKETVSVEPEIMEIPNSDKVIDTKLIKFDNYASNAKIKSGTSIIQKGANLIYVNKGDGNEYYIIDKTAREVKGEYRLAMVVASIACVFWILVLLLVVYSCKRQIEELMELRDRLTMNK